MSILDSLSPQRFVEELPELVEILAAEFPQVSLTISPSNLALVAEDLRLGVDAREDVGPVDMRQCVDVFRERAARGLSTKVQLDRTSAQLLADDILRGTALRTGSTAKGVFEAAG